jgi:hypothetical protein
MSSHSPAIPGDLLPTRPVGKSRETVKSVDQHIRGVKIYMNRSQIPERLAPTSLVGVQ